MELHHAPKISNDSILTDNKWKNAVINPNIKSANSPTQNVDVKGNLIIKRKPKIIKASLYPKIKNPVEIYILNML